MEYIWYVSVYNDYLDDFRCLGLDFNFTTEENAILFRDSIVEKTPCSTVYKHIKEKEKTYENLESALEDYKDYMKKFQNCKLRDYLYYRELDSVEIDYLTCQNEILKDKIEVLKAENEKLKSQKSCV